MKKFFLVSVAFLFFSLTAQAAVDETELVKVTSQVNPKCVEYYHFRNELYCSTKALHSEVIDPHLKETEKQNIQFDERPWQAVWGRQTPKITTIEYVPNGDDINQWRELITSQYLPGKLSPLEYVHTFIDNLQRAGFKPTITFYEKTDKKVVFEFRIEVPDNQKQDELQIIRQGEKGLYILHYTIKEADMGEKNRTKWLENLRKSSLKK